jgi:prepilin peptidase CpaA
MTQDVVDRSESTPATAPPPVAPADDLGIDRALLLQLAQVPFVAAALVLLSWLSHLAWGSVVGTEPNFGPVVVVCVGMILAAVIDGWAFKVPNWLTLSLILSGWALGLLHSLGVPVDGGQGSFAVSLVCTGLGFLLLFPMLAIGGMGQGDVKMQMGFGAWVGSYFGQHFVLPNGDTASAAGIVAWSFAIGGLFGGAFGLIMMAVRRQFHKNVSNFREIATDLQVLATLGPAKAAERANARRKDWVRLPYGVPLCVGFLGYLWYLLVLSQ